VVSPALPEPGDTANEAVVSESVVSETVVPEAKPPEATPHPLGAQAVLDPAGRAAPKRSLVPVLAAALVAAALVALAAWWRTRDVESPPPVLAVLPFATLGPSAQQDAEYLELGLADALITQLGRLQGLVIRPLGSVRRFAAAEVEPLEAGRQLGADLVVAGSLQRAGERLRVTVHVLRVDGGDTLWTGALEERATDLFAVQDAIGVQIAASLAPELRGGPATDLSAPLTKNPEAYEHYLRGRAVWVRRSRDALLQAAEHFERATALDPSFAHAYAALGQVMGPLGFLNYLPAAEVRQRMRAAAETALRLDPNLGDAHTALAACLSFHEWRWAEAERAFERAIQLNSNDATARSWYGLLLLAERRVDEAIVQRQRAVAVDPLSGAYLAELGATVVQRGDLAEGGEMLRQALELDPRLWRTKLHLAELEEREQRLDEAIALFREAADESGRAPMAVAELSAALAEAGELDEARALADELRDPARAPVLSPVAIAIALGGLGDLDGAFEWLDRAVGEGDPQLTDLRWRPRLVALGSDPRYDALLERVGLAPHQVAARTTSAPRRS
jgi:serine/threonine-protein kinase